jgi:hypothetical protein
MVTISTLASTTAGHLPLTLAAGDDLVMAIPIIAIAGGVLVAITAIIAHAARTTTDRKQYEESRREIAAYVAEGSIRPEDAERLLKQDIVGDASSNRWKPGQRA